MFPGHAARAALRERSGNLAEARQNAGANQGMIEDLRSEITAQEAEETEWLASGKKAHANGDDAEKQRAARKLSRIRETLTDLRSQLETAEARQAGYMETLANAGDQLEDDRRDVRSADMRNRMAKSEASLQTGFADDDNNFDEAMRNLNSQANRAEGQVAVNRQLKSGPKYSGGAGVDDILGEFE